MDIDPGQLADEVLYQIGALDALARRYGTQVTYVKPHGALYNTIVHHSDQAHGVIDGIHAFSADIPVMLLPGGVAVDIAETKGLRVIREAFADRNYTGRHPGHPHTVECRGHRPSSSPGRQVAETGSITAIDGSVVTVDAESVCVHGDSPDSVALTRSIVEALRTDGIEIKSFL